MPLLREALQEFTRRLEAAGVDSPRLSAQVLLAHGLGKDRIALVSEATRPLTETELTCAEHLISRRVQGEPVAYITGVKEFYGLEFQVTPATLIPRPETEHIIEEAQKVFGADDAFRFLDLGTGSGALAVTLGSVFPHARGTGLDLSETALVVARGNARKHGVAERVTFVRADFTEALPGGPVDLIVANPPYVSGKECAILSREVADFEPYTALYSPDDGLAHVRGLLPRASDALKEGGVLLLEMGCSQGTAILEMLAGAGSGFAAGVIICDLAGLDRVACATKCGKNETVFTG